MRRARERRRSRVGSLALGVEVGGGVEEREGQDSQKSRYMPQWVVGDLLSRDLEEESDLRRDGSGFWEGSAMRPRTSSTSRGSFRWSASSWKPIGRLPIRVQRSGAKGWDGSWGARVGWRTGTAGVVGSEAVLRQKLSRRMVVLRTNEP